MDLLLTSSGISNPSIDAALVELLGKPVADANALFIPTAIYPFPGGGVKALEALTGRAKSPLCELGWNSLGVLELTALHTIQRESWVPTLQETDALLVWGGNVLYLCHWMRQSGLAALLPSLDHLVYVGVSAGSIATTAYNCDVEWNRQFVPPGSDMENDDGRALGLVDFTMWVHVDNPDPIFEDNSMANVEKWSAGVPVPTYAIDDETAIKVSGDTVEVVSEGTLEPLRPNTLKPRSGSVGINARWARLTSRAPSRRRVLANTTIHGFSIDRHAPCAAVLFDPERGRRSSGETRRDARPLMQGVRVGRGRHRCEGLPQGGSPSDQLRRPRGRTGSRRIVVRRPKLPVEAPSESTSSHGESIGSPWLSGERVVLNRPRRSAARRGKCRDADARTQRHGVEIISLPAGTSPKSAPISPIRCSTSVPARGGSHGRSSSVILQP